MRGVLLCIPITTNKLLKVIFELSTLYQITKNMTGSNFCVGHDVGHCLGWEQHVYHFLLILKNELVVKSSYYLQEHSSEFL